MITVAYSCLTLDIKIAMEEIPFTGLGQVALGQWDMRWGVLPLQQTAGDNRPVGECVFDGSILWAHGPLFSSVNFVPKMNSKFGVLVAAVAFSDLEFRIA